MSEYFVNSMLEDNNWKLTENNADALKSTTNSLLDLFGEIGALRTRTDRDIESLFSKAFTVDKLLAVKMSFYARNIRGGLGERKTARIIWRWLAMLYPEIVNKNMRLIPEFGRWDDLYCLVGTPCEHEMWETVRMQFNQDLTNLEKGESVSLLAKWLKSANTSSKESVTLGRLTSYQLGFRVRSYRKALTRLRQRIDVVETKMSGNRWSDIEYPKVPSNAMMNYRNAFKKHDEWRFSEYMENVSSGKEKISTATLYPYDIVRKIMDGEYNAVLEEQWKNLPNYVDGENNMLVMADVSGSMFGTPIAISVGLAIYFAERNHGAFKDIFMTFSESPEFVKLKGHTLYEKVRNASGASWMMNTDIEKAMLEILSVAVENNLGQHDLPEALVIISDMEFDQATQTEYTHGYVPIKKTYYSLMKEQYENRGYEIPRIIFWNVDARENTFHAVPQDGVQFASGASASVFKSLIQNAQMGAYELMLNVLNDPVYDMVTI